MVPGVATEEAQPRHLVALFAADDLRREAHRVTELESQDVPVEFERCLVVGAGEHHVAQTLLLGDEAMPVRADDAPVLQRGAVEDLQGVVRRVVEDDHLGDPTVGDLLVLALAEDHTRTRQPIPDILQLSGIRDLPARAGEPVVLGRHDDQTGREIVHPEIQGTVGETRALDHAEDLEAVGAPRLDVGGLDPHVPQRANRTVTHLDQSCLVPAP